MSKINKRGGFTLAELLIVIAIIAILIAIAIPVFSSQLATARRAADHANIRSAYSIVQTANMLSSADNDTAYGMSDGNTYGVDGKFGSGAAAVTLKGEYDATECAACVVKCYSTSHKAGNQISVTGSTGKWTLKVAAPATP